MGYSDLVAPLDPDLLGWARECGVPVEGIDATGRSATLDELLEVVKAIPGHSCWVSRGVGEFQIGVESEKRITFPCPHPWGKNLVAPGLAEGPATATTIDGETNVDGVIRWVSFYGNLELLIAVVRRLTRNCGPQTFFSEYDGIPWLILSNDSVPIGPEPFSGALPDFVLE